MILRAIAFVSLLGAATILHAQSEPTALKRLDLKVGGSFATAHSDYGGQYSGGAAYINADFLPHLGVEGEFHFVKDSSDLYEKTYEVGGRYYRTYRRYVPYAKVMYGRGIFNFPALPDGFRPNLAYNLVAVGIGVDYKMRRFLYVRGDWEYQNWFGFQNSSLSPSILTIGAAYHFK
jgi:Outer membrane protein beta-barrel domain